MKRSIIRNSMEFNKIVAYVNIITRLSPSAQTDCFAASFPSPFLSGGSFACSFVKLNTTEIYFSFGSYKIHASNITHHHAHDIQWNYNRIFVIYIVYFFLSSFIPVSKTSYLALCYCRLSFTSHVIYNIFINSMWTQLLPLCCVNK